MKKILIAIALSLASTAVMAQTPSPFTPKGTGGIKSAPIAAPAYATYVKNPIWAKVIIGNNDIFAVQADGGPKTSGIYEYELAKDQKSVTLFRRHMNVKADETYTLKIFQRLAAERPSEMQVETVDGRRLIIYDKTPDGHGNFTFRGVISDNIADVYVKFSAYAYTFLPGIYDFKFAQVEKQLYIDVLTYPKEAQGSPVWLRFGLDDSQITTPNFAPSSTFTKQ